jgi:hypothetical protein
MSSRTRVALMLPALLLAMPGTSSAKARPKRAPTAAAPRTQADATTPTAEAAARYRHGVELYSDGDSEGAIV